SPIIGHGRYAMKRKRISQTLVTEFGITQFGHPHNAYLEILVDTGIIGLGICLMFFGRLGLRCFRVTAAGEPGVDSGIAGMCLAFLTVQAVAAIGSQSFYPQQSATLLWVVMGLAMCALPPSVRVAKQNRTNMRQVSLPNAGS
ncbi:MAG: O-antigen ligase family protein, partial [Pseudomonadota bacterium]